MAVTVEQVMTCDLCGSEINRLKQTVLHGCAMQIIDTPAGNIAPGSHDICGACWGPLLKAFWEVKKGIVLARVTEVE